MSTSEYEDILASLQELTQRAYALGRTEALKRVIEVMQADEPPAKPLALAAPSPQPTTPLESHAPSPAPAAPSHKADQPKADAPLPWWANKPRPVYGGGPRETTH